MHRRSFLSLTASSAAAKLLGQSPANSPVPPVASTGPILAGSDRTGQMHNMAYSFLAYKVLTKDSQGGLFMAEHHTLRRGGPPLHVHPHQDEIFYVLEGEYVAEIGGKRYIAHAGDTVFAPRNVPHVWASTKDSGKLIIAFTPAGKMEAFFDKVSATHAPLQDAALFHDHDMVLLGPPLVV